MKKILKKKNIKYYLIFLLVFEILTKFSNTRIIINYSQAFINLISQGPSLDIFIKFVFVIIIMLILWVLMLILITSPVTMCLLARKTADITQEIQNRKYDSKENIIYYRDIFKGISPTTISLMQNLRIEEEKDLAATIMKLKLNQNILIEGENIKIISDNMQNLTPSEKRLFYILQNGKLSKRQIDDWKDLSIKEAKEQGYIKTQDSAKGLAIKKIILIILFILSCLGLKYIGESFIKSVDEFEKMGFTEGMDIYELIESENFDYIFNTSIQGFLVMACLAGVFGGPIFYGAYIKRYTNSNNSLRRTSKGDKLTDEILGMKRFISDFSMLDKADKESIILWDDFLIYAIVLEENKDIVEEILELKGEVS